MFLCENLRSFYVKILVNAHIYECENCCDLSRRTTFIHRVNMHWSRYLNDSYMCNIHLCHPTCNMWYVERFYTQSLMVFSWESCPFHFFLEKKKIQLDVHFCVRTYSTCNHLFIISSLNFNRFISTRRHCTSTPVYYMSAVACTCVLWQGHHWKYVNKS